MVAYNPDRHHRQSIRLKGYDYSIEGAYFITICTHNREHLFGDTIDGTMTLNIFGDLVRSDWQKLPLQHSHLLVDESIVMPNHFHGIIILTELPSVDRKSIAEIIGSFKTFSARKINKIRNLRGVPVWQRNYYDRIIRTDLELDRVREYIINNPQNWDADINNYDRS
jgi:putative transposase